MDIVTLMPLDDGDELTGPKSVARQARQLIQADERRAAAMIAGLLLLGDERVLPLVNLTWRQLGQSGKDVLREQQSGTVFAAMVEFYLLWLGLVEEDDFGHPAGALARLAEGMVRNPGIRDIRRRFPAPFNQSDEDFIANPPFEVPQEWTKEDFARAIEPQLRMAYMRETYDKVMPRVLRSWGLEVGEDDSGDQIRRMAQAWIWAASKLAEIDREDEMGEALPWEQRAFYGASLFRDHPVETAIWKTFEEFNRLEHEAEDRRQRAREQLGSSMYGRLMQASQQFHLEAQAVLRHVQHRFGLDPRHSLMTLQVMRTLTNNEPESAPQEGATQEVRNAPRQLSPQDYGALLSTALESLGTAAAERDHAIRVMMHPPSLEEVVAAAKIAAAATKKVDDSLEVFTTTVPPDDCVEIHGAFLFAISELLRQWPAELAALGANLAGDDGQAALHSREAQRAGASFRRGWSTFKEAFDDMERDRPELASVLQITPTARAVIAKDDWDAESAG